MPRKHPPIRVTTRLHAPQLLAAARHYANAAARYQNGHHTPTSRHLAHARFLEVTAHLDKLLTTLVLRTGSKHRTLTTAADAALIKAAARNLADHLSETHIGPTHSPAAAQDQLTHTIYETLASREAEDHAHHSNTHQALAA